MHTSGKPACFGFSLNVKLAHKNSYNHQREAFGHLVPSSVAG